MSDLIRIKRSETVNNFSNIVFGELAYTVNGDILYVGDSTDGVSVAIAGRRTPGTLSANQAIVVNSSSYVDILKTANLVANSAHVDAIVLTNGGISNATTLEAQTIVITTSNTVDLNVSGNAIINALSVTGNIVADGDISNVDTIFAKDIQVGNTLTVNGDIVLRGDNITLGDGGDVISLGATVNSHIIPDANVTYDLGSGASNWRQIYANQITVATNPTSNLEVATKQYVDNIEAQLGGNSIVVGPATDGAFANGKGSTAEGAVMTIDANTKISDAVDKLNEVVYNVYKNNYVRDVSVTVGSGSLGGAPLTSTLSIVVTGNATHYDVNWGDGSYTNNTTDSTPSHTYTDNTNSPFDITVTARNSSALGEGNTASVTATDLITLYTGDPNAAFNIYNVSSGGATITEANINETIYIDNDTTNANDVVATFFVNWGDGSSNSIANTSVDGGTQGGRLAHTYTSGTGTGSNTITLSINTHSTANPSALPDSASKTIKIFDTGIAAPSGLSAKTFTLTSSSVGTSPRLASGFINNTSDGTFSADDTVTRYTTTGNIQTTGSANSSVVYDAAAGSLSAIVDGSVDGTINFDGTDNTGSNASVVVVDELDFYNFDNNGSSASAANRRYAPGLYSGFRARVSKSSLSTGTHTYKLSHSTTGNTGVLEFVKDNLTGTPVINMSGASLTQNSAGTLAYVSGVPYYTNDAVLDVSGVTVSNVAGQTYRSDNSPFQLGNGTMVEHDQGNVFGNQTKAYSILPSSSLNGGYPIANTGMSSTVTLEDFTITTTGGGRCVSYFDMYMRNVNGNGSSVEFANTKVQAYNGNSSGVNELSIPVSDSLGATYDTDGIRLSNFSSTNATPTFANNVDYYVNNAWSGAVTVAGTDEAIVRYGDLKHYTTDLSSGYLPVGPDLNTNRSGVQYFRFAFKRTTMSNFTVRMTGNCASFHVALPGTSIDDTSNSNGWVDAGSTYAGAGTPGANTTAGGNGSDGVAFTTGDRILANTNYSNETFAITLGDQNGSSSTNNQVLISIGLHSGQSITSLSIE